MQYPHLDCNDVPLDVQLASKGLSIKLFPHQVPELTRICARLEDVRTATKDMLERTQIAALTRACVLFMGIRGEAGVRWATKEVLRDGSPCRALLFQEGTNESRCSFLFSESQVFRQIGRTLVQAHDQVGGGASPGWASHREKRHVQYSGRHHLQALATLAGSQGAARLSHKLAPFIKKVLKVNPQPWADDDARHLLERAAGNLPLRVDEHGVAFAHTYNSVNSGFTWLIWAWTHGHIPLVPFGPETFDVAMASQGSKAQQQLRAAGST